MKEKGFTLIELLAVIVILAIIALIATPIILNIIGDTKKSATDRSKEMYLDAVEQAITRKNLKEKFNPSICTVKNDGNLNCDVGELELEFKGQKPLEGGSITFKDGKIIEDTLKILENSDNEKPVIERVSGNTDTWSSSKTISVQASDTGGSKIKEYSFDGGLTWQTSKEKIVTENGTYIIKVKDNAGNISDEYIVEVSKIDNNTPTVLVEKTNVGSNYITVRTTISNNPMGFSKIEYSKDNGVTWENGETSLTHTFTSLLKNTNYKIKTRVISNNSKVGTSEELQVNTKDITTPIYSVDVEGVAPKKTVTITYPIIDSQALTYEYSLDKGITWKSANQVEQLTFTEDGSVIARVLDGTNIVTANTFTVDNVRKPLEVKVTATAGYTSFDVKVTVNTNNIKEVKYYLQDPDSGEYILKSGRTTNLSYSFSGLPAIDRSYSFKVEVEDMTGQTVTKYGRASTGVK